LTCRDELCTVEVGGFYAVKRKWEYYEHLAKPIAVIVTGAYRRPALGFPHTCHNEQQNEPQGRKNLGVFSWITL
jgi:hypothetical protein